MWAEAEKFLRKDKYIGPLVKKWGSCAIKRRVRGDYFKSLCGQKLRDCGMSWGKVSFVKDLAYQTKNLKLKIKNLDKLPDDEVLQQLIHVKGIGRWTAEMFLMFSLARPDIFPVDDLGIRKAMAKLKLKSGDRWKPYRTVASWYLWRSLENLP